MDILTNYTYYLKYTMLNTLDFSMLLDDLNVLQKLNKKMLTTCNTSQPAKLKIAATGD